MYIHWHVYQELKVLGQSANILGGANLTKSRVLYSPRVLDFVSQQHLAAFGDRAGSNQLKGNQHNPVWETAQGACPSQATPHEFSGQTYLHWNKWQSLRHRLSTWPSLGQASTLALHASKKLFRGLVERTSLDAECWETTFVNTPTTALTWQHMCFRKISSNLLHKQKIGWE